MTTNQRNMHQVWRIMEDSKTFHPLEEKAYNALVTGVSYTCAGGFALRIIKVSPTGSLKLAGYTTLQEWFDIPGNPHWPSSYALLVRNDTQ